MMAVKKRKGKLVVWKSKGKFYWKLLSSNGKSIAIGGEGYDRKATMARTLESIGLMLRDLRIVVVEK